MNSRPTDRVPVWLLALTAGVSVANLYYNQPLLPDIARAFGVSEGAAAIVNTATQVGYAVGMLLFVPLGDVLERRRLIALLLVGVAVSLVSAAVAPTLSWLVGSSFLIGVTTIVPQLVIPYGAGLAPPAQRGRVVGHIMGGLLIGILAARVLSGALGAVAGWRAMFVLAAVLMIALAVAIVRLLPASPPTSRMRYPALLRSLVTIARQEPVVRDAAAIGALTFAAFSAFWTTLAFRLEFPPLHYGSTVAGMFGLVGIVGALAAPMVGRLADKRTPRATVLAGLLVLLAAYLVVTVAGHTLIGLVIGVIVLDAGMQAVGVSNQARIYALPAEAHSRLNTVYMVTFFAGGSLGSLLGAWAWEEWRWVGVCGVMVLAVGAAFLVYLLGERTPRSDRQTVSDT
jgi:predicted MFS family arabinose efflux permease